MRTERCTTLTEIALAVGLAFSTSATAGELEEESVVHLSKGVDASIQFATYNDAFWGLQKIFAPSHAYDSTPSWIEVSAKPWLAFEVPMDTWTAYGRLSALGTGTLGTDVFDQSDSGRIAVEEAYLGVRGRLSEMRFDLSAGSREFRLGEGLLLHMGGGNGFERGAPMLAPHRAWKSSVLASLQLEALEVKGFLLKPDELASSDTNTSIYGASLEWASSSEHVVGASWFKVSKSEAPYPQSPVTIIDGGREGLETLTIFGRLAPEGGQANGFSAWGEVAFQRNSRINMAAWGGGLDIGWRWSSTRWRPRLSWSPRIFSGDDPSTPNRLERFDPLYYDGSPSTWSSGANGSFAFYNSNLRVNRVRLELTFGAQDFASLSWYDIRADRSNSPIQYGQGARPVLSNGVISVVSGFPDRRLTQELYFEHTHVFDQHRFLTWGIAVSVPRAGIRAVLPVAERWFGAMANYTVRF